MRNLTEADVRAIRDRVFCEPSTDWNWHYSKEHWMKPEETQWLQDHDFPLPDRTP